MRVRLILFGAGWAARRHLQASRSLGDAVEIVAICDINHAAAEQVASQAGIGAVYSDPQRCLAEADADAVDICTTNDQHAELAIRSAEAGRHVLVEKPMAISIEQCREMIKSADAAGVVLMVGQMQRYDPAVRGVHRAIASDQLGRVVAVRIDAMQDLASYWRGGTWMTDGSRAGGGAAITAGIHRIDLARYVAGEVDRVAAVCRSFSPVFANNAEDFAAAIMWFRSGAIGEVFATFAGVRMPWGEGLMLFGSEASIVSGRQAGDMNAPFLIGRRLPADRPLDWNEQYEGFEPIPPDRTGLPFDDPFANELAHFVHCCQTGQRPLTSGQDNIETMKVIFGIYKSARTGTVIDLADL